MSEDNKSKKQKEQVKLNYKVFSEKLPELIKNHENKYALIRDGKIIEICDSLENAYTIAWERFEDDLFSVQKITDAPVNLGIFSSRVLNIEQLQL